MGKYPVSAAKEKELLDVMDGLGIHEEDLEEQFIRGSGKGGQKINTSANCVRLKHLPSGLEVRCQADRSLSMNRFLARRALCEKVENEQQGKESKQEQEREKIRRQKRRRSKRAKEKILADKKAVSEKKSLRKKVLIDKKKDEN
ncbi:peptide chain release factor-like protein [bacterium]|nr:peptide chain release factor-like protein [bacterium]